MSSDKVEKLSEYLCQDSIIYAMPDHQCMVVTQLRKENENLVSNSNIMEDWSRRVSDQGVFLSVYVVKLTTLSIFSTL